MNCPSISFFCVSPKSLKEGGVTALEEAINHPVVKILISATKGFLES
jgi:hypothetical protein